MKKVMLKKLMVRCPSCGKYVQPQAYMTKLGYVVVPVARVGNYPILGWDYADAEGDYKYICPECEDKIADGIVEIEDKWKAEKEAHAAMLDNIPKQPRCPRCHKFMRRHQSGGIGKTSRVFKCSCGDWTIVRVFDLEDGKWVEWAK